MSSVGEIVYAVRGAPGSRWRWGFRLIVGAIGAAALLWYIFSS